MGVQMRRADGGGEGSLWQMPLLEGGEAACKTER